jgi:N-acyl homoserine lactone hydrolase
MTAKDPISNVSVFSTGSVAIRPEHVGPTRQNMYLWLLTSRRWTRPLPVNVYVVEHRDGLVLFDTGQDRASVTDPGYFPSGLNGLVYSRLAKFEIEPDQTLSAGLRRLGHDVGDVRIAVISHLHQDHIGGLPDLAQSELLVSRSEWRSLHKPLPEVRGVLLPTPGHTPGSVSMVVRRPGRRPLLMVGDLTYDDQLLAVGKLPGVGDKRQMRITTRMVNDLRAALPGLVVLPAHDPSAAQRLLAALDVDDPASRAAPGPVAS